MKWTEEQQAVFAAQGDLKVNAVAGSGKTTTLMELARQAIEQGARVTYIAFNRKVKEEAAVKAAEMKMDRGFRAVTAHGLAYGHLMQANASAQIGSRPHPATAFLPFIDGQGFAPADRLAMATHAEQLMRYFCNASARKVVELNYLDVVAEDALDFAVEHLDAIVLGARRALAAMERGDLAMTHDFYLKRYALSRAFVPGDLLLFDEGQDASPAMLEVFLRSPGRKVIVGDRHQQIYGWRHAVNSLDLVDFPELPLSASFRFPGEIAALARDVVGWKRAIDKKAPGILLRGRGKASRSIRSAAVLTRTNVGLFEAALAYIASRERVGLEPKVAIAGNLQALLQAEGGGSAYDLLNIKLGKPEKVRDEGLAALADWEACKAYATESGDPSMRALVRLVEENGRRLPGMIQRLKRSADRPGDADITFSTVHQAKGMEWDAVVVWPDFAAQTDLADPSASAEEVNVLYVAATRARAMLFVPDAVFDATDWDWAAEPRARIITPYPADTDASPIPERKGGRWSTEADAWLRKCFQAGLPLATIAGLFGRTYGAIKARLQKLELIEAQQTQAAEA